MSHVTRTPLSRSKGQGHQAALLTALPVGASGGCSNGRQNVLVVGNCCYVAVFSAARGVSAPTGGRGEGRVHIVAAACLQLVYINSVRGANRLWGETSIGRNVYGAKCRPWGKMSVGRNVLTLHFPPLGSDSWICSRIFPTSVYGYD